jgi:nitrate reductase delta subunit
VQRHFVEVFDMKRRACPFLTYWTHGDTRNRGVAILRFKQAYEQAGFSIGTEELPDHLAVVLEFAAVGDRVTGDALLAEHAAPIGLLREALHDLASAYAHLLDAVVATLPEITPEVGARMAQMVADGPPVEDVGLEPFPTALTPTGARR